MSKTITVGSETFELPTQGQSPKWGEELSDIIEALADSVNLTQGPADILETNAAILNTSGSKNVTGFLFSSAVVRSFEASYNVARITTKTITSIVGNGSYTVVVTSGTHDLNVGDIFVVSGCSIAGFNVTHTVTQVDSTTQVRTSNLTSSSAANGIFNVELVESGLFVGNYGQQGWKISPERIGSAKLDFDISSSGQITYSPEVLSGTAYSGSIVFLGKAVLIS